MFETHEVHEASRETRRTFILARARLVLFVSTLLRSRPLTGRVELNVDEERAVDSWTMRSVRLTNGFIRSRCITGCGEAGDRQEYLQQLVNRLEDVTKRLEKVPIPSSVQTQETSVQVPSPKSTPAKSNTSSTQDSPTQDSSKPPDPVCSSERIIPQQPASMSAAGYEDLLAGPVKEYLELSQKIGGDVAAHSKLVEKAFQLVARTFALR